jgi:hypothetical protein
MARDVAARWLAGVTHSEYRFSIFGFASQVKAKKFASSLRAIRDRHQRREASTEDGMVHIPAIVDLGVRERGDAVEVWSSNVDGLRKLAKWAETVGLSTDFIW